MSSPIKRRSRTDRKKGAAKRTSYLRLYGDVVDELNDAVRCRVAQGHSRASIAKAAGIDPSTLSRVLSGREGNNLRTIAAVLFGADYRMKIQAVPIEELHLWDTSPSVRKHRVVHVLNFEDSGGRWGLPKSDSATLQSDDPWISSGSTPSGKAVKSKVIGQKFLGCSDQ